MDAEPQRVVLDPGAQLPLRTWVEHIMGLPISVHVRGPQLDDPALETVVQTLFAELRTIDELFSTYKDHSQLNQIRRGELSISDAHPDFGLVERACLDLRNDTNGHFNAWPTGEGPQHFDPTGWVKGWAVQRASQALLAWPDHDSYVNAGGDMILSRNRQDSPWWRIGIENPLDRHTIIDATDIANGAIATSGSYLRGLHIHDAQGNAVHTWAGVTVTGPTLELADAYATAAYAAGDAAPELLRDLTDYSALLVDTSGAIRGIRWLSAFSADIPTTDPASSQLSFSLVVEDYRRE